MEATGIDIITNALVTDLVALNDGWVTGVTVQRPDGTTEKIGCQALILACNGYGGNLDMVRQHIPEMAAAEYFGHPGNQGDAVQWGASLGAAVKHMGAYQGHGSIATPHGILITWALMMEGGIQVNCFGKRFSNEHRGYSEQAVDVLSQPDQVAWLIIDDRLLTLGREFDEFKLAEAAGAVRHGSSVEDLSRKTGIPGAPLEATLRQVIAYTNGEHLDPYGRDFTFQAPLCSTVSCNQGYRRIVPHSGWSGSGCPCPGAAHR